RAAAILAPLHPDTNNVLALERQIYQAILERRPAPIIGRLKEVLAQPHVSLGYFHGELLFWLGWAEQIGGDDSGARMSWQEACTKLESLLAAQPENHFLIGDLALITISLGDKAAAQSLAERCLALNPVEKDAIAGPRSLEVIARVAAGAGEPDRAIPALEK